MQIKTANLLGVSGFYSTLRFGYKLIVLFIYKSVSRKRKPCLNINNVTLINTLRNNVVWLLAVGLVLFIIYWVYRKSSFRLPKYINIIRMTFLRDSIFMCIFIFHGTTHLRNGRCDVQFHSNRNQIVSCKNSFRNDCTGKNR